MKHLFLSAACACLLSSCALSAQYIQVCRTSFDAGMKRTRDAITYEDANCVVTYNLWDKGGHIGFEFYNKTEHTILVHLDETFLIINGIAHDYFQNRTFSRSSNRGMGEADLSISTTPSAAGGSSGSGSGTANMRLFGRSVSHQEERLVAVPARSAKVFSEYAVSDSPVTNCALPAYPDRRQPKTLIFDRTNSPLVFSNRISYHLTPSAIPVRIENEFFVSEVTNFGETQIMERVPVDDCPDNRYITRRVVGGAAPDKFFIPYRPAVSTY